MELANKEHEFIKSYGHDHFLTLAAAEHFKEAWEQVRSIQRCFGLPSFVKEVS